ncbi:MAG: type II secretion system protein [Clostridia bacterium]|nr:type II secretion system protein [Clostridia bacterium]
MREEKGVTLVALVVTIIILLILAAVTISLTLGQDGIITKAQQAGKNYLNAQEYEQQQLAEFTNQTENIINGMAGERNPYNGSEFRKSVVKAITEAGVKTSEEDTDETIIANIGKISQGGTTENSPLNGFSHKRLERTYSTYNSTRTASATYVPTTNCDYIVMCIPAVETSYITDLSVTTTATQVINDGKIYIGNGKANAGEEISISSTLTVQSTSTGYFSVIIFTNEE